MVFHTRQGTVMYQTIGLFRPLSTIGSWWYSLLYDEGTQVLDFTPVFCHVHALNISFDPTIPFWCEKNFVWGLVDIECLVDSLRRENIKMRKQSSRRTSPRGVILVPLRALQLTRIDCRTPGATVDAKWLPVLPSPCGTGSVKGQRRVFPKI